MKILQPREITLGVNEAIWDGRTEAPLPAASGVYFYELEWGTIRNRAKLTILR